MVSLSFQQAFTYKVPVQFLGWGQNGERTQFPPEFTHSSISGGKRSQISDV